MKLGGERGGREDLDETDDRRGETRKTLQERKGAREGFSLPK